MSRVLFIDNFDSFTYNVVHLLAGEGARPDVVLNDDASLQPSLLNRYDALVVGPGPGKPGTALQMMAVLREAIDRDMPVLGVCLGLQAIGEALGAAVVHAPKQMHGKVSQVEHDGTGLFEGLPSPLAVTRYHSLCLDPATMPSTLTVTARSDDAVVQAVAHARKPVYGVQFHPESVLSEGGQTLAGNWIRLAGLNEARAKT